jgi:adenylate cyclase
VHVLKVRRASRFRIDQLPATRNLPRSGAAGFRTVIGTARDMTMKKPILRDALARIQEIIAKENGAPLAGEAEQRLQNVLTGILSNPTKTSSSDKFASREITILLADLRGFSSISETYPIAIVVDLLNQYLTKMSEIIQRNHGTINKFMGDSIMALFSAEDTQDHVRRAVVCAVEMQIAMDEFNRQRKNTGAPELYMGIGINTGTVMAGLVGSDLYSEYTVIGDDVNLVSRIEAFSLRGQVLISHSTFERCKDYVTTDDLMDVYVKGKANPVSLHEVIGIPSLGKNVPRREIRRSARVTVEIPFVFQLVKNKLVMPESYHGTILDISYHGVQAELGRQFEAYSEIKLNLDLSLVGYKATDIYAKILKTRQREDEVFASVEFTSVSAETNANIRHFVQLLVQGSESA